MISRENLKLINSIYRDIKNKSLFTAELMEKLKQIEKENFSQNEFKRWLFSWEATAELDRNPEIARRVRKAYKEIQAKKKNPNGWKKFKQELGLI